MRHARLSLALIVTAVLATACTESEPDAKPTATPKASSNSAAPAKTPKLGVSTLADGLEHPWDIAVLPSGGLLFTERDRERVSILTADGKRRTVLESPDGMWHGGETGLMGIELAPDFDSTREFITCHGYQQDGTQDVRAVRWRLDGAMEKASKVRDLVTGLPSSSGRHGGCSLEVGPDDSLFIGVGDAAIGTNSQDLGSGGGKILRVDAKTGDGLDDNPHADDGNPMTRRVWSYGHRNVQGLAFDANGNLYGAEHGPAVDDEVNLIRKGGNYGWNPVPGYNESVPMTDDDLPGDQISASWSSGSPTLAISGAAFLAGDVWGTLENTMVVPALKDESLRFMRFDKGGKLEAESSVKEFDGEYGRLRGATVAPDGTLYVTSSNGSNDVIIKVAPR